MPSTSSHQSLVTQELTPGTEGQPIELLANFYKLTTPNKCFIYHYDLAVERPRIPGVVEEMSKLKLDSQSSKFPPSNTPSSSSPSSDSDSDDSTTSKKRDLLVARYAGEVIKKMLSESPVFSSVPHAHDGEKNLYTTTELNLNGRRSAEFPVHLLIDNQLKDFTVRTKLVGRVQSNEIIEFYTKKRNDLSDHVVSVFEVILRFIMGKNYVTFQRKLFDLNTITRSPNVSVVLLLITLFNLSSTFFSCRFNWPSSSVASLLPFV